MQSFIGLGVQNLAKLATTLLCQAVIIASVVPSLVGAVTVTQVNDRAKIIVNSSGTCIRSSTATTTSCSSSLGGNILAYLPAGQTRTGTVQSITPSGGFNWFNVNWDSANPVASGYVRTDVVQLDVPLCSWSQSPPGTATVGVSFSVSLSCYGNPTQYGWDFFNGATTWNTSNPHTVTYASALGAVTARGFASNAAGTGNASFATINVVSAGLPPVCNPSTNSASTPVGSAATLTSNCSSTAGTISYQWTATNGGPAGSSPTSANNTVTPATAGTWNYSLLVSNGAGSNTYPNFYSVQATAAGTPPACAPVAFPTSIPAGNGAQLESNCAPNPSGGTIYSTWSAPLSVGAPTLSTTSETYATTVNVANTNTVGSFTFALMARNFYGTSGPFYVTLQVTQPVSNGITLTSPLNNAVGVSTTPSFTWSSTNAPSGYILSVEPADGVGLAPSFATLTNSFTWPTASPALQTNKQYKWRVQVVGQSSYSDYSFFTTNNTPPPGVVAVGPNINLGQVRIGGCSTAQVAVTHLANTAAATASVTIAAPFDLPSGPTYNVSNGQGAPLSVRFCPTSLGSVSRTASVSGTLVFNNTPFVVTGEGVGQASAPVYTTHAKLDEIARQQVNVPFPVRIQSTGAQNAGKTLTVRMSTGAAVAPTAIKLDAGGGWSGTMTAKRPQDAGSILVSGEDIGGTSNQFEVFDPKNFVQPGLPGELTSPTPKGSLRVSVAFENAIPANGALAFIYAETAAGVRGSAITSKQIIPNGSSANSAVVRFESLSPGNYQVEVILDVNAKNFGSTRITANAESTMYLYVKVCKPETVLLLPGIMGSTVGGGLIYPRLASVGQPEPFHNLSIHEVPGVLSLGDLRNALSAEGLGVVDVPWDWRLTPHHAAGVYLKPAIDRAKLYCPSTKVHVVAHSMGGLVARAYIQGLAIKDPRNPGAALAYDGDIDRFVMLGTPNGGSALPYWMLEGGDPQTADDVSSSFLSSIVGTAYPTIAYLKSFYTRTTQLLMASQLGVTGGTLYAAFDGKRAVKTFYSGFLPGASYLMAPYILSHKTTHDWWETPPQSTFNSLDRLGLGVAGLGLNSTFPSLSSRYTTIDASDTTKVRTALFLSIEEKTIDRIAVDASAGLYVHGRPVGEELTEAYDGDALLLTTGDGTVPAHRSIRPWLDDPERDLSGSPYCLRDGCILPSALPATNGQSRSSVISIKTGGWGKHPNVFTLHQCVLGALIDAGMHCRDSSSGKRFSTATEKALSAATPNLVFESYGDAGLLVGAPGGQQSGQTSPTNTVVTQIPNSTVTSSAEANIVNIGSPVDGVYSLRLVRDYFAPTLLRANYIDSAIGGSFEERINVFPGTATTFSAQLNASSAASPLVFARSPAKPTLSSTGLNGMTRLTWTPIGGASKFRIYTYLEDQAQFEQLVELPSPTSEYTTNYPFNSRTETFPRRFAVVAVDATGNESFYSNIVVDNDTMETIFEPSISFGAAPLTVQFTDRSSGVPTSWSWDFNGDGVPDSSAPNPSFTYAQPGRYSAKLVASNATQTSEPRTRLIRVDPTIGFATTNPTTGVTFTVTGAATESVSTGQNRVYPYGSTIIVTAPATAGANAFVSWTGCPSPASNVCTVTVGASSTLTANYSPGSSPVNGACGAAHGSAVASAPINNLCAAGTPSAVLGSGPWTWSCAGTGGGTTAQCSAAISGSTPVAFAFAPKTNVAVKTPVTSDPVTISGITVPVNVAVTNGEFSIGCSGVFVTAPGTVVNNQTICVRHVSATLNGTNKSSLLDVGGVRAAFSSVTVAAGGCTVQPSPGKDTYYGNVYLTTGMPTAEWIHVGGWGDMYRSYVQIDVSSLPPAANTVSAELQLYITNASVADPLLRIYRIDSAWTDVGVTIAAQPSVTYLNEAPRNATTGTWYRLDITNLYKEWKNGTRTNFGVMLEPGYTVNSAYTFASSEAPTAAQRPKIVVQSNNGACSIPAMTCDLNIAGRSVGDDQLDGTMLLRYLLGFRGAALTAGLTLSGSRKTYQEVEQFLSLFNYDIDGSGKADPTVDGLILLRLLRGATDAELLAGVVLPANATVRDAAGMRARAQACRASMIN